MLTQFMLDDTGFIVSAELVLVATILVLGMLVGMSQVQHAVATELNDFAHALGALNQSYFYSGFTAVKGNGMGLKSFTVGSAFHDFPDACDWNCQITCAGAMPECGACGAGGWGAAGFGGSTCAAVGGIACDAGVCAAMCAPAVCAP